MPRASDSTTDTYLDVLRTLGVTDAALRRHHDAAPETPLRVAIDGDRGAPTADLLSALGATGRVLDLRDGLAAGDGDRLTAALSRFGYAVECSPATDDDSEPHDVGESAEEADPADLQLRVRDAVTDDVESLHTASDAAAVEATLSEALLAPIDVELVELLDGRHLVAETRELELLAASYGERIEPFDDPLLVPDAAVEVDDGPSASAASSAPDDATSVGELWGADVSAERTPSADQSESGGTPSEDARAAANDSPDTVDDGDSFGEALAEADDATTDSIEAVLSAGGPSTHTIEEDDDLAAASESTVGGGPRRTVSTTGIDEVFDQLESSTAEADSAEDHREAADSQTTTTTMENASDPPTEATESSDDAGGTSQGLRGGPQRTVSTTSADDILARATGERDFETIAAEEGDADPDAVLAEGEVPEALEDSGVPAAPSSEAPDAEPDVDESAPSATSRTDSGPEEIDVADVAAAEEPAGAADRPPADPAPPASTAESAESSPGAADEPTADEVVAPAAASASTDAAAVTDDPDSTSADDANEADEPNAAAADDDSTSPVSSTAESDRDERAPSGDVTATPEPSDLGDDLLEDDVELREGSASVDDPDAPADDPVETDDEPAAAEGPLAARGGLRPDDAGEPEAKEPAADPRPAEEPAADDRGSADATGGAPASDDSTTDTPERTEPTTDPGSPATDEESDAVTDDDSAEDGTEAGLVGRITSTIFGR